MSSRCCVGLALFLAGCVLDSQSQEGDLFVGADGEIAVRESSFRTPDDPLYDPEQPLPGRPRPSKPAGPGVVAGEFTSIEELPLWLIELEVTTANVEDAGTDDSVALRMKLRDGGVVDLNLGGDDRERADTQRYIVNPWSVRRIQDIEQLELYKSGDDGWAISSIAMRVNGDANPIFSRSFGSGLWLDSGGGHARNVTLGSSELRAHPGWTLSGRTAILEPPSEISGELLERMIEGAMGDALEEVPRIDFGTKYGRSYVEAERASNTVTNVDLDLDDDNGIFSSIEVDTNFSITWSCVAGILDFELSRFDTPELDFPHVDMQKGRFFLSVEDMLLRLRALTQNRPYRCSAAPSVRSDGGIKTNIERKPTPNKLPIAHYALGDVVNAIATDNSSPSIEEVPVWSLHVETETANVADANTDDPVDFSVTDNADNYRLTRNADNRERGAVERYLVNIPNIRRVGDIERLDFRLPIRRDDGWCVQRVALFVNDEPTPLFEQHFDQCRWVDTDGSDQTPLTITGAELRADSRWSLTGRSNIWNPSPTQLTPSYLRSRLENPLLAMMIMEGTKFEDCTNLRCIQIERGSGRSVFVSTKYVRELSLAADEHYEMNFDLEFRCLDGRLEVDARNAILRDFDVTKSPSVSHLNAFADYFENMTLIRHCTRDPQVVDYGNTFLNIGAY